MIGSDQLPDVAVSRTTAPHNQCHNAQVNLQNTYLVALNLFSS
jgi:hypothetical protein